MVDIAEETDAKELPPCIIRKSDGAALYATSDLATIVEREQDFHPDHYIYVVDKRQGAFTLPRYSVWRRRRESWLRSGRWISWASAP